MAKMYYTEAQACERLQVDSTQLMDMVRKGKLHAYADGPNKMFKVAEVDGVAPATPSPAPASNGDSDIQLAPVSDGSAGSGTHETISLSDSNISLTDSNTAPSPAHSGDTTAQGTSGSTGTVGLSGSISLELADSSADKSSSSGTHALSGTGTHGLSGSGTHDPGLSGTNPLSDSGAPTKSDTVITSEGISIFDDEDLEIETADPMAKTQIAPSLDEQIGGDNASAGSGLLDLTRESDDTSLGAEVLGHIDMESGDAAGPSGESVADSIRTEADISTTPAAAEVPLAALPPDPSASTFTGLAAGAGIVLLVLAAVSMAVVSGATPPIVEQLGSKLPIVIGAAVVIVVVAGVIGMVLGKKTARGNGSGGG